MAVLSFSLRNQSLSLSLSVCACFYGVWLEGGRRASTLSALLLIRLYLFCVEFGGGKLRGQHEEIETFDALIYDSLTLVKGKTL